MLFVFTCIFYAWVSFTRQDTYGLEKLYHEEMCKAYAKDFPIETRMARYHNVYGPRGTWKVQCARCLSCLSACLPACLPACLCLVCVLHVPVCLPVCRVWVFLVDAVTPPPACSILTGK